ncbi:MAG TPA: hypothetical protein VF532_19265 [Candidatus Angelobacter sp.]
MRSEDVFAAAKKIGNRFMLCRVISVSARSLQVHSKQPSETINKSLRLIAAMAPPGTNGAGHTFSLAPQPPPGKEQAARNPKLCCEAEPKAQLQPAQACVPPAQV